MYLQAKFLNSMKTRMFWIRDEEGTVRFRKCSIYSHDGRVKLAEKIINIIPYVPNTYNRLYRCDIPTCITIGSYLYSCIYTNWSTYLSIAWLFKREVIGQVYLYHKLVLLLGQIHTIVITYNIIIYLLKEKVWEKILLQHFIV